ncbi:hypothetical protein WMY93_028343 [Mugilogobius chulae]|uniref:Uncharacterized protein n=1 Tax=Mugilogobius chulae TaxID=88201 RepID=A0AAW0MWX9_9GOBI
MEKAKQDAFDHARLQVIQDGYKSAFECINQGLSADEAGDKAELWICTRGAGVTSSGPSACLRTGTSARAESGSPPGDAEEDAGNAQQHHYEAGHFRDQLGQPRSRK